MTNRDLWIRIGARVDGFMSGIGKAQVGVRNFTRELEKSEQKRQALNEIGNGFGLVGAAATAAGGLIVKSFADFDEAMSAVESTGQDARDNIAALRDMAVDMGAKTKFNATESAAAIEEMARAGVTAKEILGGGLQGALDMAAAGNIEVGEAAAYASQAMNQFGLRGKDVPRIADLLAAAAGKANGEISDFGQALNQAGIIASDTGLSIEETTGGLAAFAQSGLLGSDAGTSFKTMLQRLNPSSKEAAELMKDLGLSAYDSSGEFVGLADYAGRLQSAFKGMSSEQRSAAMETLFGSDAIRAANVLYREGEAGINKWVKAVDDQGFAAETAATKMDNLKGDFEQFTGALETAMIGTGEGANGPLRDMVQQLSSLVEVYNDLPQPAKDATLGALGLTAAVGGGTWAVTRALTSYASLQSNLSELGLGFETSRKKALLFRGGALAAGIGLSTLSDDIGEFDRTAGIATDALSGMAVGFAVGGPWGSAIGGAIGLVKGFGDAHADAAAEVEALIATYDRATGKMTEAARAMAIEDLNKPLKEGLFGTSFGAVDMTGLEAAKTLGIELRTITDAAMGSGMAMQEVNRRLGELRGLTGPEYAAEAKRLGVDVRDLADAYAYLGDYVDENSAKWRTAGERARDAAEATSGQIETTQQLAAALAGVPVGVYTELKLLDYQPTALQIDDITRRYNLTPEQVQTVLAALDRATPLIDDVDGKRRKLDGSDAEVRLRAQDAATGTIRYVRDLLENLDGDRATVTIETHRVNTGNNKGGSGRQTINNADGGVWDFFANGGLRENHVAQIAPAGAWRVWAEPETGGEAYIPLHPSKRSRSIDIWAETGRRLGMQGFADGGFSGDLTASMPQSVADAIERGVERGVERGLARVRLDLGRDAATFRNMTRTT
ncbi:phage tail tape measure protein [Aeromicrobium sp. 179-A 4D2 NHS]|uniref:phage tail tape measure protein n=1 Tax=Aeromicrobium sp. 179-A 4D2 NHS TaxID=3142375 RepID=UPI0039A2A838